MSARYRIHLCLGPNCSARGSAALLPVLEAEINRLGLTEEVEVIVATCRNRCDHGPSLNVYPGPFFYNDLSEVAIEQIVQGHLRDGNPVSRWLYKSQFLIQNKQKFGPGSRGDWNS